LAIDVGIFDLFNQQPEGWAEFSVSEIAAQTNIDPMLIGKS
jgi:hypothetical protein